MLISSLFEIIVICSFITTIHENNPKEFADQQGFLKNQSLDYFNRLSSTLPEVHQILLYL